MALKWWEQKNIIGAEVAKVKQKAQAALGYFEEQKRQRDVSWVGQIERQQARATEEKEMWRSINQQRLQAQAVQELKNASHALTMAGFGINQIPITPQTIQAQVSSGFTMAQKLARQGELQALQAKSEARAEAQEELEKKLRKEAIDWAKYRVRQTGNSWADYSPASQEEVIDAEYQRLLRQYRQVQALSGAEERVPRWVPEVQQPEGPEDLAMMGLFPESLQLRRPEPLVYKGKEEIPVTIPSREEQRVALRAEYGKPMKPKPISREGYVAESKAKDIWDAFYLGARDMWQQTKEYFPLAFARGMTSPEMTYKYIELLKREAVGTGEAPLKLTTPEEEILIEKFTQTYNRMQADYNDWVKEHPELQPRPEWEKGVIETVKENPTILLDSSYWAYVAAESAAFCIAVMGTTLGVTALTGNPILGGFAGVAVATPFQAQDLYEDCIAAGATPEQAGTLADVIGPLIASVEVAGDLPFLMAVSRPFANLFRRGIQKEVVRLTVGGLLKKGLKTFMLIEVAETLEEIIQGAIQNATVKIFDENRQILENMPETVVRTLMATVPFALVGGGANIRRQVYEQGITPPTPPEVEGPTLGELATKEVKPEVTKPVAPEVAKEVTPAVAGVVVKEPWQMTRAEFITEHPELRNPEVQHRGQVFQALRLGKEVPTEVMADYPDIRPPEVAKPVAEVGAGVAPAKLRSTIMAWGKQRGLSQIQLNEIFKKVVGKSETGRQLPYHLTRMTPEQLRETLAKVKIARPRRIRGKVVITEKTENKIQSLKSNLATKGQMDDENFARLLKDLKLKATGYETSAKFITESEGKGLIRAMLDEADTIGWRTKVDAGLAKHPNMASAVDTLKTRIATQKIATLDKKPVGANPLLDMRYYTMTLQQRTGKPLYETWQALNNKRLVVRYRRMGYMDQLRQSTPQYAQISQDEKALKRVSDYIAAKNKLGPKTPANITQDEIALAKEIERQLYELRGVVRFVRFDNAYDIYGADAKRIKDLEIKDAPIKDLREAIDIYEGQGKDALIEYLGTKDWGIIKSGYEPLSVVNPKIYLFRPRTTTLGKGHIRTRTSIEYPEQDRNILQRYNSYLKQILNLQELASPVRTFARAFDESAYMLKNPRTVANDVSRAINEMKGYSDVGGPAARLIARVYSQVMTAVFWDPYKWVRNLCQNIAFHPDRHLAFDPSNVALTAQEKLYSDIFVSQKLGLLYDYLMRGEKPFPGLGRITRLANKTSRYPQTDESNRRISFWLRINKVNRAIKSYHEHGDIDRLIKDSGLDDLELLQKKEALELLSQDVVDYGVPGLDNVSGEEAFARYIAREVTNNTHFMYERSLRSPASMGPLGRVMMNLATFPRSYAQRIILQMRRLKPGSRATGSEKRYGLKTTMGIIVAGILIGEVFARVTGRKRNPYDPLTILSWTPGGLSIGATQEITGCVWDIAGALAGDKDALNRATTAIPRVSDLVLPFYGIIIESCEAATDMKNIDRYALRKLREKLDEEYKTRGGAYRVKRDFFEKLQHAIFGGEVDETKEKTQEELLEDYMDELMGATK